MERFDEWDSFLCHHGIKGQKWGVRNYQNADGSLTAAGKERYGGGKGFEAKSKRAKNDRPRQSTKELKRAARKEKVKAAMKSTLAKAKEAYKRRHPEKMSDDELKRRLNRLTLEKQYRDLSGMTEKAERNKRLRNLGFNFGEATVRVAESAAKGAIDVSTHKIKALWDIGKNVSSRYGSEGAKSRAELTNARNATRRQKGRDKDVKEKRQYDREERLAREEQRRQERAYEREKAAMDLKRERERRAWEREKNKKGIP